MDEKLGFGITVADLQEYVVKVLTIRELSPASERSHRLLECWASATMVRTDGNLVTCDVRSDARIQPNDATVARLRYHNDRTEARFE